MMKNALPLNIVYRIYYKLMKTTLEPQALLESSKGQTLLLQCNTQNSTICIPKQIRWDDVWQYNNEDNVWTTSVGLAWVRWSAPGDSNDVWQYNNEDNEVLWKIMKVNLR